MVLAKVDERDGYLSTLDAEGLKRLSTPDGLSVAM